MNIGSIFIFLFKTSMVLLALLLAYKLMLANDKQPAFNRALLLSFYIAAPAAVYIDGLSPAAGMTGDLSLNEAEMLQILIGTNLQNTAGSPLWTQIILIIWIAGMLVTGGMTAICRLRIHRLLRRCEIIHRHGYTIAITDDENIAPFSIRKTAVMSRKDFDEAGEIIIMHELRHIKSLHRLDLCLARLAIIACWFNPATWLMADELRAVHEYQADETVLKAGVDSRRYQMLLIKKAVGRSFPAIANSLNHSNLKKRITMMLKTKQNKKRRWRVLMLVPAAAAVLMTGNIPAVSNAMTTVGSATITMPSTGKGTQNPTDDKIKKSTGDKPEINITLNNNNVKESQSKVVQPQFPGGQAALFKWLIDHIKFPDTEAAKKITGIERVAVKFIITAEGKVTDPQILKESSLAEFNEEALRVVRELPDFIPGMQDGKPVSTSFVLPVNFTTK